MNLLSSLLTYTARQIAALRAKDASQDTEISGAKGRLATAESNLSTLASRIETAIAAVTTSTEVTDIRVGDDGVTYDTAGTAVRTQFAREKTGLQNTNMGVSNLGLYAKFVRGGLSSGVVNTSQKFRVATNNIISFDRDIKLNIASGFKIGVHTFVNGSYSADSGWQTGSYSISAGTTFKIVIGRTSDDTSEIADIGYFVNQVTFVSLVGVAMQNSDDAITDINLITSTGRSTFASYGDFAQGGLHEDGSLFPSQHHRVSGVTHIITDRTLKVYVASGYKCGYEVFANGSVEWHGWYTGAFTIPEDTEFVLQICNDPEDSSVYADVNTYVNAITVDSVLAAGMHESLLISKNQMTRGSFQPREFTVLSTNKPWITYLHKTPVNPNTTIVVKMPEISGVTWKYRFAWYDSNGAFLSNTGDTLNNYCSFPNTAYYFAFGVFATDNGTVDDDYDLMSHFPDNGTIAVEFEELVANITSTESIVNWGFDTFVAKPSNVIEAGYYHGSDLIKHKLLAEKLVGTLICEQAFCIYDNKYYSVEEGKLGIQDESFNTIDTVTLDIGHGNTIQLGSANLAYVNGTFDHKVYIVDLDEKEVVGSISLPFTTGLDSTVIDDINNIAYILHTETSGEVYSKFEFVAYDLTNEEILYKRYLPFKILQFQAMDFYEGKILLLAGTNDNIDNRLFVLDLNGTALANMKLSIFASDEPEGVFFDRDNGDLYVSSYNRKVYKLIPLA